MAGAWPYRGARSCRSPLRLALRIGALRVTRSPPLVWPLLTSRSAESVDSASPFQTLGEISPGKTHRLSLHERRIYERSPWSRELRGQWPARPDSPRLLSDSCTSPRRSRSPLLSAILSRSSPCGSLGSLRPT